MKLKKLVAAVGIGLGLTFAANVSLAFPNERVWSFQDDDIDFLYHIDSQGNWILDRPNDGTGGTIGVGDVLLSVFEMPEWTEDGNNMIPAGKELTGIAAVQLLDKDANDDGIANDWIFGLAPGGLEGALDNILGADDYGLFNNSAIAMWLNDATDKDSGVTDRDLELSTAALNPQGVTNCTDVVDCVTEATMGTLIQIDGFGLDPDEFWVAFANPFFTGDIDNIDLVHDTNKDQNVVTANFGLSNLYNIVPTVYPHNILTGTTAGCGAVGEADGCVQGTGFVTITGGQNLVNGAFGHSDANAKKIIPEPATLALMGAGLFGFGAFRRKKS